MRNRKNNNIKNVKDYIVPAIIFALIIFLIYMAFSPSSTDTTVETTGTSSDSSEVMNTGLLVELESDSSGIIINAKEKETAIDTQVHIQPGEKLVVEKGSATLRVPGTASMTLDGRISYGDDKKFMLNSSKLWISTQEGFDVGMKYVSVSAGKNSVINLEQNEVSSTVYLMKGTAEVKSLGGVTTFLSPGKKIQITNKEASQEDLDMTQLKEDFSDFFKTGDWYIKNNLYNNISEEETIEESDKSENEDGGTSTGSTNTAPLSSSNYRSILSFDGIYDEGSVEKSASLISGKFVDDTVAKIVIDGKEASINTEEKTFSLGGVDTSKAENDIIVKVYDTGNNTIGKYVFTLYYNGGTQANTSTSQFTAPVSYPVNPSDFIVSSPTVKGGVSYNNTNTVYGAVKNPNVKAVTVNGYRLKSFNGSTWRYHAFKAQGTLLEGVNNYTIRYLGADGSVLYTGYLQIHKKSVAAPKLEAVVPTQTISGEANAQ